MDASYEELIDGSVVELRMFDAYGNLVSGNFARYVMLVLPYKDADNDGIVDGITPQIKASSLRIYCLNTNTLRWEIVDGDQILDANAKTVSIKINHFSIYALVSIKSAEDNLSKVKVFPNPYKESSTGIFADSVFGSGVVFDKLTANVHIRIYNIAGERVADLTLDNTNGRYVWDCTNNSGQKVASGVYIYMITNLDSSSDKLKGKLVIIR